MSRRLRQYIIPLFLATAPGGYFLSAQTPAAIKERLPAAQKENAAQLRLYRWSSRSQFSVSGQTTNVKVEQVWIGRDGHLQKRLVGGDTQPEATLLHGLERLAESYAYMTPEQMRLLTIGVAVSPGKSGMEGTLSIARSNLVLSPDTVVAWVDPSTFLNRQVKADTRYENDPVALNISYEILPEGPNYPARVEVIYPKREVRIMIQNSNHQRLPAEKSPEF